MEGGADGGRRSSNASRPSFDTARLRAVSKALHSDEKLLWGAEDDFVSPQLGGGTSRDQDGGGGATTSTGSRKQSLRGLFLKLRNGKMSAFLGIFILFCIHEILSVSFTFVLMTGFTRSSLSRYKERSADTLKTLYAEGYQAINRSVADARAAASAGIKTNINRFFDEAAAAAETSLDIIASEYFTLPLYNSTQLLGPNIFTYKHKFLSNMLDIITQNPNINTLAFAYDADGSLIGARDDKGDAGIQRGYILSHWIHPGDGVSYCNIREDFAYGYQVLDINEIGLRTCPRAAFVLHECNVNETTQACSQRPEDNLNVSADYNVLNRTWYALPRELYASRKDDPGYEPEGIWSPIYTFVNAGANLPGITFTVPYVRPGGPAGRTFVGATMVDINLRLLAGFLVTQKATAHSLTVLIERSSILDPHRPSASVESGRLIALSDGSSVKFDDSRGSLLPPATQASHPLVRATAQHLLWKYKSWLAVPESMVQYGFDSENISGETCAESGPDIELRRTCTLVEVGSIKKNGVDWIFLIIIPEEDYSGELLAARTDALQSMENVQKATNQSINGTLAALSVVAAVWIAVSLVLALRFSYLLSQPLKRVAIDMTELAQLSFSDLFVWTRIREVESMVTSYLRLRDGIQAFAKFVPQSVVRRIVSGDTDATRLQVTRRRVTVLFSDISNFTEQLDGAQDFMEQLAEYLGAMVEVVESTGGTVGDFVGGGMMAFWNSPDDVQHHARMACGCSLLMLQRLERLNNRWKRRSLPQLNVTLGIHTGLVLSGNIGSQDKLKFGVVGDTGKGKSYLIEFCALHDTSYALLPVNLASRVERLNKAYKTGVLITSETLKELVDDKPGKSPGSTGATGIVLPDILYRPIDKVGVKGRQGVTEVWELLHKKVENEELAEISTRAFRLYQGRQFQDGARVAQEALTSFPADSPLLMLLEKCERFTKKPPPLDWDGSTQFRTK